MRKAVPGLLKEIEDRGYLLAPASSTSRNGIEAVLTSCGLKNYFDYVVIHWLLTACMSSPKFSRFWISWPR